MPSEKEKSFRRRQMIRRSLEKRSYCFLRMALSPLLDAGS